MCYGLGFIVSKELNLYTTDPDEDGDCSHTDILNALDWPDSDDQFGRKFVRIQMQSWDFENFEFDEMDTLPTWAEEGRDEIASKAGKLLKRIRPHYLKWKTSLGDAYQEEDEADKAYYETVFDPAHDALWKSFRAREITQDEFDIQKDVLDKAKTAAGIVTAKKRCADKQVATDKFMAEFRKMPGYVATKKVEIV